eukprot:Nitzschia sp. Nitz4//scaffold40_size135432//3323//5312//NITZ4_003225-RA/size135432-snap-gene-0.109-mRNA-1//1//CDS//3329551162//907//frame0
MSDCHWKSATDPRTGRTYYYHEITRETQWRKPLELASDEEIIAMQEKERKQKDFFAAMEANILNSMSQGLVPGKKKSFARRKSSRKPAAEHPDLVRTISTMDNLVLKNLVQRQPSFRNIRKGGMGKASSTMSLDVNDFDDEELNRRNSAISSEEFESFVSIMTERDRLDPLHEASGDESMPELFSYLPDDGDMSLEDSGMLGDESGSFSRYNESSVSGFGLNWEETQALKKLANITKEMISVDAEDEPEDPTLHSTLEPVTPSWKAKDSKGMRDLPREIELDDGEESDIDSPAQNQSDLKSSANRGNFQKAKDIGGRELDFEDSDEDSDDDEDDDFLAPTPMVSKKQSTVAKRSTKAAKEEEMVRPEVQRRNTCSTMYVGTTMSAPDKDATIKCVCGVLRTHILSSESLDPELLRGDYRVFNDREENQGELPAGFHNNDCPRAHIPSLDEVTKFYRDIYYKAQMETDCIIMSLIYVERLVKRTGGKLRPTADNWRSLIFSCMILSSKVWDDLSMWNVDFSQSCPPGVSFSLQRINELELAVLNALNFQVKVPASEYAKYYFLLRTMLIKSGLGGEKLNALDPLDVMGARRMQEASSQFENLSLENKTSALSTRSQSLNVAAINSRRGGSAKLGLEQVVKM